MATVKKTASRGLGKGLSALMSESYSQTTNNASVASEQDNVIAPKHTLTLDKIVSGKYQPRDYFNETALKELADSIRKNGVMQPILVRQLAGGNYEIIAGERRWRASKIAGLTEIPVIIREMEDEQALELAIVENVQREDLHPLEESSGYQRLMDEFGYTQENLASTVHKSRSHIANLLRLQNLDRDVRSLFAENKITMGHARALIGVENASDIALEIVAKSLNVRQTEKLVSDIKNPKPATAPKPKVEKQAQIVYMQAPAATTNAAKDPDIIALEDTLSENLGLKVSISDRGQSGEITIAYDSLEQLDEVLRRLGGSIY